MIEFVLKDLDEGDSQFNKGRHDAGKGHVEEAPAEGEPYLTGVGDLVEGSAGIVPAWHVEAIGQFTSSREDGIGPEEGAGEETEQEVVTGEGVRFFAVFVEDGHHLGVTKVLRRGGVNGLLMKKRGRS